MRTTTKLPRTAWFALKAVADMFGGVGQRAMFVRKDDQVRNHYGVATILSYGERDKHSGQRFSPHVYEQKIPADAVPRCIIGIAMYAGIIPVAQLGDAEKLFGLSWRAADEKMGAALGYEVYDQAARVPFDVAARILGLEMEDA
jgi:hypothetical protein